MIERMTALMQGIMGARAASLQVKPAEEAAAEALKERHGERALLIEARQSADGRPHLFAVLDADRAMLSAESGRLASDCNGGAPAMEVIDRTTWEALQRLKQCGLIQFVGATPRLLHESSMLAEDARAVRSFLARPRPKS